MTSEELQPGREYVVSGYPFRRETVVLLGEGGVYEAESWIPGVTYPDDPYGGLPVADGLGELLLTIVSLHKPGKYPERAFYVRQFRGPDGEMFGKTELRVASVRKFGRLLSGYAHPFMLDE